MNVEDIKISEDKWTATGRRLVGWDGKLRAEMRKGATRIFPYCRPHEGCPACVAIVAHTCPMVPP